VRQYEGKGDSRFGVVDMAGNVWEWCSTYNTGRDDLDGTGLRVLWGGSWGLTDTDYFRCDSCDWGNPVGRGDDWGFRLALSP
jgi:formylglycine-generating enzyme required for sulfatase activity